MVGMLPNEKNYGGGWTSAATTITNNHLFYFVFCFGFWDFSFDFNVLSLKLIDLKCTKCIILLNFKI